MLLSINQRKIEEQLANSPPMYVVSPCNWEGVVVPAQNEIPTTNVTSAVSDMSPELERYRDRVLSLRQRIIERGEHPASSTEELERILDETRGRL